MAFESLSLTAAADICHHLSKEAPAAPSSVKPAFNEESPELLPGQPPARQRDPPSAISTQQVRLLRFCKQEKTQIESCQCCSTVIRLRHFFDHSDRKCLDLKHDMTTTNVEFKCKAIENKQASYFYTFTVKGYECVSKKYLFSESTLLTKPFPSWQQLWKQTMKVGDETAD